MVMDFLEINDQVVYTSEKYIDLLFREKVKSVPGLPVYKEKQPGMTLYKGYWMTRQVLNIIENVDMHWMVETILNSQVTISSPSTEHGN